MGLSIRRRQIREGYTAAFVWDMPWTAGVAIVLTSRAWPGPARLRGFHLLGLNWNYDLEGLVFVSPRFLARFEGPLSDALRYVRDAAVLYADNARGLIPFTGPDLWDAAELTVDVRLEVPWNPVHYGVLLYRPSASGYNGYSVFWAERI